MKYSKLILAFCFLFGSSSLCFAQEHSVSELLEGYLANDLSVKQLVSAAQKQTLNEELTNLNRGIDLSLSTGTVTIKTVNDKTSVSFKPNAELTVPQAANLRLSAETTFSFDELYMGCYSGSYSNEFYICNSLL